MENFSVFCQQGYLGTLDSRLHIGADHLSEIVSQAQPFKISPLSLDADEGVL